MGHDLVGNLRRLEAVQDLAGLLELLQRPGHDPNGLFDALCQLLPGNQVTSSYIIAMLLANTGFSHPVISLALMVGGMHHNNPQEESRGREALLAQVAGMNPEQRAGIDHTILCPVALNLMAPHLGHGESGPLMRILELLKVASPRFGMMFDREAPEPEISRERLRRRGRERAELIVNPLPPAGSPRPRRRALATTWGKAEGLGPLMAAAMRAYGWDAVDLHLPYTNPAELEAGCRRVVEHCAQTGTGIVVVSVDQLMDSGAGSGVYHEMIVTLRRENPGLKVVGILYDAWGGRVGALLERAAPLLDVIWTSDSPSLPVWRRPELAGKVLQCMTPFGVEPGDTATPLTSRLYFRGTLQGWNWPRAFWLAAIEERGMALEKQAPVSLKVANDGLPHLESYAHYIRLLREKSCVLSLTMRQNLECVVVGRSFEAPYAGALLVQEETPDMNRFFVSGEHYLEFATLAELAALMRFVAARPDEADEIRRAGHAFALERYGNDRQIGYLDALLHFPASS